MRTTLILNDDLVQEAAKMTSIKEKTALVHAGLRALLQQHAQTQLAQAGGSQPKIKTVSRRRPKQR